MGEGESPDDIELNEVGHQVLVKEGVARSSCPACARGDREHGAPSDVAAVEEKGIKHRRFTDSQPPAAHARGCHGACFSRGVLDILPAQDSRMDFCLLAGVVDWKKYTVAKCFHLLPK
ncbi:Ubiquitin Carboxyl-Terminal Hydrolase 25 [Manis pentadactyla]|nr:Ubiquitin Carboxyl-Terminal Hydrolase 25 [Manis pentadactyla]